ncbi:hypothetical protein D5266_08555 [bacterium c-19]|nr:hypothetical protein [bacterium c-19]
MIKKLVNLLMCLWLVLAMMSPFQLTEVKAASYPNWSAGAYNGENPLSAGYRGQCTWYVWGRVKELHGIRLPGLIGQWQNAGTVSSNPTTASIALIVNANGTILHTAYIESVNGNSLEYSEANSTYFGDPNHYYYYSTTKSITQYKKDAINYTPGASNIYFVQLKNTTTPKPPKPDLSKTIPTYSVDQSTGKVTINWNHAPYSDAYRVHVYDTRKNTKLFSSSNLFKPASNKLTYTYQIPNKGLFYFRVNSANPSGGTFTNYFPIYYTGNKVNVGNDRYVRLKNRGAGKYVYYDDYRGMLTMKTLDNKNDTRFLFKLIRQSDGSYKIQSAYNPSRYMDIKNNVNSNGTLVELKKSSEAVNPSFNIYSSSYGGYVIAKNDGKTVFDGASTNGNLYTWEYVNTNNQYQYFDFVDASTAPSSISLNRQSLTITQGYGYKLQYKLSPSYASTGIRWTSSSSAIAKVDQNGNVKGVKPGSAYITARTENGLTKSVLVKVVAKPNSVKLNYSKKIVSVGSRSKFQANVYPQSANQKVTWRTGNSKIATVDKNGVVTGKSEGLTWLYAKTINGKETRSLVKVIPQPRATFIDYDKKIVTVGKTTRFNAQVYPVNANQKVTWRIGNPKIATVDRNGKVTAKSVGMTWVYAKAINGKETRSLVKVIPQPRSVRINCTSKTMKKGTRYTFKATVNPTGANQAVTWRTGNTRIATVDQNGRVTAKATGSTYLYAKAINGKETRILIKVVK